MYLYFFLVFFETILSLKGYNGLVFQNSCLFFFGIDTCLVFFRDACLVFLGSKCCLAFFPRCFFYAFSRAFECEWFREIFSEFNFQFKIRQTFIFCKFVHFQGDIFVVRVPFLFSRSQQFLLATHVINIPLCTSEIAR